jgi:hypothetical protein
MDMDIFWFALGVLVVAFTLFYIKQSTVMDEDEE